VRIFIAFALPSELLFHFGTGRIRTCDPKIKYRSMILKRHLIFYFIFSKF